MATLEEIAAQAGVTLPNVEAENAADLQTIAALQQAPEAQPFSLGERLAEIIGAALPTLFFDDAGIAGAADVGAQTLQIAEKDRKVAELLQKKQERETKSLEIEAIRDRIKQREADRQDKENMVIDAAAQGLYDPKSRPPTPLSVNDPIELGQAAKDEISRTFGIVGNLDDSLKDLEAFKNNKGEYMSAPEFQAKALIDKTLPGRFQTNQKLLIGQITKAIQGSRPSDFDFKLFIKAIQGDKTVGPAEMRKLMLQAKRVLLANAVGQVRGYGNVEMLTGKRDTLPSSTINQLETLKKETSRLSLQNIESDTFGQSLTPEEVTYLEGLGLYPTQSSSKVSSGSLLGKFDEIMAGDE